MFTKKKLQDTINDSNAHLYCMYDGTTIIGCATLCVFHSPTGTKASVEDVIISSDFSGQHLGKQLMERVLEEAKKFAPIELHLTSNPMRVAANALYQSIGFQKKETNCYRMSILAAPSETKDKNALKQSITYVLGKERSEGFGNE